jgi:GTP-binding nuclear protein Ran
MEQAQRIKVALVGEGGVGKTAFLTQVIEGCFERRYMPTTGVETRSLEFSTNHGSIIFDVWDTAGQEKFRGVPEVYFNGSHACIAMFDVGSVFSIRNTIGNLKKWIGDYTRVSPATPIAICRTKTDMDGVLNNDARTNDVRTGVNRLRGKLATANTFCEISTRNRGENCSEPFLWIAREITGHADLVFI